MPKKIYKISLILTILLLTSCSTQRTTLTSIIYHNLTAYYNVFFNAKTAFEEGVNQIEQNCKINWNDLIPLFPYNCPNTSIASDKMHRTIRKATKTYLYHSLKNPPQKLNLKPKPDYCLVIDDSFILKAKAYFYLNQLDSAKITLNYLIEKFKKEPIRYLAEIWLAKIDIKQNDLLSAENRLKLLLKNKKFPQKYYLDLYLTLTELYIKKQNYQLAAKYLEEAFQLTKNRKQKAKYAFLLGQLYLKNKNYQKAAKYFKLVEKFNPPYQMAFNAKLYLITLPSQNLNFKQTQKQLLKLLKDEKNEEYKSQIYHTLAILYLTQKKDTSQAIKYLKQAIQTANSNLDKANYYLELADLYFKIKDYPNAGLYYDSTLKTMPKDFPEYQQIKNKSKALIQLANYLKTAQQQDSLLKLSTLPKQQLYKIIDSIIKAKQQLQNQQKQTNYFDFPNSPEAQQYMAGYGTTNTGGKWYFYNPMLVAKGKQIFRQKWGDRPLEDNWRRKNKSIITQFDQQTTENPQQQNLPEKLTRQYFLKQIPFSDSAKKATLDNIAEALFNAALIYETQLNDLKQAKNTLISILNKHPQTQLKLDIYYHLYLIGKNLNDKNLTALYRKKIITEFPNSKFAKLLLAPQIADKIKQTEIKAQKLLIQLSNLYNQGQYLQVINLINQNQKQLSSSETYPSILILKAKAYASINQIDSAKKILTKAINISQDPQIKNYAQKLLNTIEKAQQIDSIYTFEPNKPHILIVFLNNPADINKIKFELFKQANLFFKQKTITVQTEIINKKPVLIAQKFDNYSQAKQFYDYLQNTNFKNFKILIFSENNYLKFKQKPNILYYEIFYTKFYTK